MNDTAQKIRESRLRHTLKSYEAAVKQFLAFKAVLPISTRKSESSSITSVKAASSSKPHRRN